MNGSFPTVYEPTIFESLVLPFVLPPEGGKGEGIPLELQLVDTAGQEDFDRLRGLSCMSLRSCYLSRSLQEWILTKRNRFRYACHSCLLLSRRTRFPE